MIKNETQNKKDKFEIKNTIVLFSLPNLVWVISSIWEKRSQHLKPKILFTLDTISPT
jgi:hypothetical protein